MIRIIAVIIALAFPMTAFSDTVLLKSGNIMQGDVLSEGATTVKFKCSSGQIENIKRDLIASIARKKDESLMSSEELYGQKVKSIPLNSAQDHYELGLFCLDNGLMDHAATEFNRAKDIDPTYERLVAKQLEYIDSVRKETEKIINMNGGKDQGPSLTQDEINTELGKGSIVKPVNKKDEELITAAIGSLKDAGQKEAFAREYIGLGDRFSEKAQAGKFEDDDFSYFRIAPLCYDIALRCAQRPETRLMAEKRIEAARAKLRQMQKAGLIVPFSKLEKDAMLLFIKGLESDVDKKSFYGMCFSMGDEYMAKVKNFGIPLQGDDLKNLEIALNYYEIAKKAYNAKDALASGIMQAKIQECMEWLRNNEESGAVIGEGYSTK